MKIQVMEDDSFYGTEVQFRLYRKVIKMEGVRRNMDGTYTATVTFEPAENDANGAWNEEFGFRSIRLSEEVSGTSWEAQ